MRKKLLYLFCAVLIVQANKLCSQKVTYSPSLGNGSSTRFEVVGKAGDYYWIQKSHTKSRLKKPAEAWLDDRELRFEIYDIRMNLVSTVPSPVPRNLVKEYLVAGDRYFDQLLLEGEDNNLVAVLQRYTPDGNLAGTPTRLATFPGKMKCGDFILVRSRDKSKTLLLGFETMPEAPPKLHAILFDENWKVIYQNEYSNQNISKPLVQYDVVGYPVEDYNSAPVKLGNEGMWLMIVSSGTNRNYLLFQCSATGEKFAYKEIKLSSTLTVEDAGLYLDNEKQEGFAGILSRVKTSGYKNVRIVHYTIQDFRIDFDTSYSLNTSATGKIRNEKIFEEYFMTIPGKGFLFLKEYGKAILANESSREYDNEEVAGRSSSTSILNPDEYTRYNSLAGTRSNFDRGDLTLYYFPARPTDSCWSGIINKEQITELGKSYLSYVFLPAEDKLFFLYNSFYRNKDQYSSATVLDRGGNSMNEGVEYWKVNNTLVFQKARQISTNELAIPYERNAKNGFAIIRL